MCVCVKVLFAESAISINSFAMPYLGFETFAGDYFSAFPAPNQAS